MQQTLLIVLTVGIIIQRLLELRVAEKNRQWALEKGAKEYGAGHYPLFFLLHSGWMLGWIGEGFLTRQLSPVWPLWLTVFLLAQGLRYWAIHSLGPYWNTRILVIPGGHRVEKGPYRFLRHPNYVAVALELLSVPLVFSAWKTALIAAIANFALLTFIRIPEEERALREFYSGQDKIQ